MKLGRRLPDAGLLVAMLALLGSATSVRAGTITSVWNGGTGNWSVATDWTPNGVPNNGGVNVYNVAISSAGTNLLSLGLNATIASLALGGFLPGTSTLQNISGTAETLEVTGATTVNGTGNLTFGNASTLKLDGGLTLLGSVNINGATTATITGNVSNSGVFRTGLSAGSNSVTVPGTFTNNAGAGLVVGGSGDVVNIGTLTNSGSVSIVGSGATLNVANDVTIGKGGGVSLNGSNTTTLSVLGGVNNSGEFGTGAGTANVSGAFTNNAGAELSVGSGSAVNVGSLSNAGLVVIYSGATLNLTSQPGGITDVPQGSYPAG